MWPPYVSAEAPSTEFSDVDKASDSRVEEKVYKQRKSEPMMGSVTSAMKKHHENFRRRPNSKRRVMKP